ncbi:outer membrane protein [Vibrio astriarenae]|nr:outer membrane protein [Vibrio sp. C7]
MFGADGEFDENKAIDMSYLPTAYYTPEKKFGVGLLMVGLYHTEGSSSTEQLITGGELVYLSEQVLWCVD